MSQLPRLPVKYVELLGAVNLGGMHTRNLDASRDLCALHLHQETGGVFVTRGEDEFYITAHAIGSMQLEKRVEEERHQKVPAAMLTPLAPSYPVMTKEEADAEAKRKLDKGVSNFADDVLKELGEDSASEDARETTRPSTRGARKSRKA